MRGVRIATDWAASPPVEVWRRPIGPAWSSFAVHGDLLYTQEQRGDDEIVASYNVTTGKPVWMHRDATRFWESNGGAGPRATPTLSHGRVYAFGATGILTHSTRAPWCRAMHPTPRGFTSSPVIDDRVIIAVRRTLATSSRHRQTALGRPAARRHYSSPQLYDRGVAQILLLSRPGAVSVAPADGALLWEHSWEGGAICSRL